jgi:psiF repeat
MTKRSIAAALIVSLSIGAGAAWAEDVKPDSAQPAATKMSDADKKAIAKSCSDQANAKGLHGKARKIFRSACKHNGGKAE